MFNYIFFIILFSLLVSITTGITILWYLSGQKQIILKRVLTILNDKLNQTVPNSNDETREIEDQINDHLNEIIAAFKREIPMINMVLGQKKEDELKHLAKVELMKMLPALKKKYLSSVNAISNLAQDHFSESTYESKFNELCMKLWKEMKLKIFLITSAVGVSLGFVGASIFYLFFGFFNRI